MKIMAYLVLGIIGWALVGTYIYCLQSAANIARKPIRLYWNRRWLCLSAREPSREQGWRTYNSHSTC